jgi:Family of unknown function (DUF6507)
MADYDIHPPGVQRVMKATAGEATDLLSCAKKTSSSIKSANVACDDPFFIGPALAEFHASTVGNLQRVLERTKVVLETAQHATQAYIDADMRMTQNVVHEQRAGLRHLPKA